MRASFLPPGWRASSAAIRSAPTSSLRSWGHSCTSPRSPRCRSCRRSSARAWARDRRSRCCWRGQRSRCRACWSSTRTWAPQDDGLCGLVVIMATATGGSMAPCGMRRGSSSQVACHRKVSPPSPYFDTRRRRSSACAAWCPIGLRSLRAEPRLAGGQRVARGAVRSLSRTREAARFQGVTEALARKGRAACRSSSSTASSCRRASIRRALSWPGCRQHRSQTELAAAR